MITAKNQLELTSFKLKMEKYMEQAIFVCRHGHRADDPTNPEGKKLPQGRDRDPDISPLGMRQAEQSGVRLKNENIKYVYCSPFLRAIRTAHLIVSQFDAKLEIWPDWGFSEFLTSEYFSDWPGTIHPHKLAKMFPLLSFKNEPTGVMPDCPEEYWPMHDRYTKATKVVIDRHPGENVLIVAHAASVMAITAELSRWKDYQPLGFTCGISKLVKNGDKWKRELNSDVSHLDLKYI